MGVGRRVRDDLDCLLGFNSFAQHFFANCVEVTVLGTVRVI